MNAVARRAGMATVPTAGDAEAIAALLKTQDALTSVYLTVGEFEARYPGWRRSVPPRGWKPPTVADLRLTNAKGRRVVDEAHGLLAALPPLEEMWGLRRTLKQFHDEAADERQTRLLIGLFVDRFPTGRPNSPTVFVEGLIHQALRGQYSPSVVAKALDDLLTASPWLPSPHELQKALVAAAHPGVDIKVLERAAGAARSVREAISEAGKLGPIDMTPLWREAVEQFAQGALWSWRDWGPSPADGACEAPSEILEEFGFPAERNEIEF